MDDILNKKMSKGLRGIEAGTTSICTVGETGMISTTEVMTLSTQVNIAFLRSVLLTSSW